MRSIGHVKWYNDDKGFGFLTEESSGKDVFVHHTTLEKEGLWTLAEGQRVSFVRIEGPKGLMADAVWIEPDFPPAAGAADTGSTKPHPDSRASSSEPGPSQPPCGAQ